MMTRVRMKATVMPSIAPAALYLVGEFCETSAKISPGHFARSRGKAVRKLVIRWPHEAIAEAYVANWRCDY